jgi:hypothetical protein
MGSIMTPWLKSYDTQIYTCTCTHVFMLSLHVSTVYDSWIDLTRWRHCIKIQSVTWRSAVVSPCTRLPPPIYIYIYQIFVFFSNPQIGVQFSNLCHFSNSQMGVQFSNLWPFLTFSNRRLKASLTYALILAITNKPDIDLKISKGRRFQNSLKSDRNLR